MCGSVQPHKIIYCLCIACADNGSSAPTQGRSKAAAGRKRALAVADETGNTAGGRSRAGAVSGGDNSLISNAIANGGSRDQGVAASGGPSVSFDLPEVEELTNV